MEPIAYIRTDFHTKFGVPRQSGIVGELQASIIFEHKFAIPDAVRGLDGFSHIWLIWEFSQVKRDKWSPLVRPPRLGGNTYIGVFATRSPYRPNGIGLSCVELKGIEFDSKLGPVLHVCSADLVDGTPIYDIKPYLPYTDSHPEASSGFSPNTDEHLLKVDFPDELLKIIPPQKQQALISVLALDPRPSYQNDESRIYGIGFGGFDVKFRVKDKVLTVFEVKKYNFSQL